MKSTQHPRAIGTRAGKDFRSTTATLRRYVPLVLVALLMTAGFRWTRPNASPTAAQAEPPRAAWKISPDRAAANRKDLFDKRRAQFEGRSAGADRYARAAPHSPIVDAAR